MEDSMISKIVAYCRENIRNYDAKCEIALDTMDEMRCSFSFAYGSLYDAVNEYAEEWLRDNTELTDEQIEEIMDEDFAEKILFHE